MKCFHCGKDMELSANESITYESKIIGSIALNCIEMYVCRAHAVPVRLLTPAGSSAAEKAVREKEAERISFLPVRDFVTSTEAAEILEISKQAMSKKLKTHRNLFVVHEANDKLLIYRRSVQKYRECNDGRVPLCQNEFTMIIGCDTSAEFSFDDNLINKKDDEKELTYV